METAAQLMGRSPLALSYLGCAYAGEDRTADAQKILAEMQELARKTDVAPITFAWIFFCLGEIEKSFDWLEKSFDAREIWIFVLNVNPFHDSLRSHQRFQALLRKMNLQP